MMMENIDQLLPLNTWHCLSEWGSGAHKWASNHLPPSGWGRGSY